MAATKEALYKAHVKNLREVSNALRNLLRALNASLSSGETQTSSALLKTCILLLGAWSENRLNKLLYEPNGFSSAERDQLTSCRTQIGTWKSAIEIGFRKRYKIPNAPLDTALQLTPRSYYQALTAALDNELNPIIEMRNKLAHGQWVQPLNNKNTDFSQDMRLKINNENAHTIKCKFRMLEIMAQMIHDLVTGNGAFERDIDKHFQKFENAKRDIMGRNYVEWVTSMQAKYKRGKIKRNSAPSIS
ncbi:hypothetical protein [Asticcacaulis tiandongensis]|uniref:hypothetical protein n=1 Tax=Asticcacaulis tiandongensis TaxID=2565365 RepID=UPI0011264DEC|nr:hypothetical protein [Asticcacaulis tiandongensis]